MKKFLGMLAISGALVACGNSADADATADTTTVVAQDTMSVITDTTVTTDTIGQGLGNNPVADTTSH